MYTIKVFALGAVIGVFALIGITQLAGALGAEIMYTAGNEAGKVEEAFTERMIRRVNEE